MKGMVVDASAACREGGTSDGSLDKIAAIISLYFRVSIAGPGSRIKRPANGLEPPFLRKRLRCVWCSNQ